MRTWIPWGRAHLAAWRWRREYRRMMKRRHGRKRWQIKRDSFRPH